MNTPDWQLAVLPKAPQYFGATPTECSPFLGNSLASMREYLQLVSSPVARKRYTSPTRETVQPCWGFRIIGFIRLVSSLFCVPRERPPLPNCGSATAVVEQTW